METYSSAFENDDLRRSKFIRELAVRQLQSAGDIVASSSCSAPPIPKTLVRYWHDSNDLPSDVKQCLDSWNRLDREGFQIKTFNDLSAKTYIADNFGIQEASAFSRCRHPAMRSDYFRMCFLLIEGGLYVDADDVLISDGWRDLFRDGRLKLQPLCYDLITRSMVPASQWLVTDLPTENRVFYVNNDPLAASAGHPLLVRALARATEHLLRNEELPIIQSTTGPGNLTIALAAHAQALLSTGATLDFKLLRNWDEIAETRWDLSYRGDARNWRNVEGSGF